MPVAAVRRGCHHHCTASEREFPFPDHPTKTIADASVAVWRPMFELFVGTVRHGAAILSWRRCLLIPSIGSAGWMWLGVGWNLRVGTFDKVVRS
jgi:hypothetical protein